MLNYLPSNLSPSSVFIAVIILVVIALVKYLYTSLRSSGPWGLPWFGYYPFLRKDYLVHMTELVKTYGDAYVITMAGRRYLHLGSIKALREAYVTKADCFGGRPHEFSIFYLLFKDGIFCPDNDESWRIWRKFLGQAMRELGIGPGEKLKGPILNSVQEVLDTLAKSNGKPVDFYKLMSFQCTEIVRRLILGNNVSPEKAQEICQIYSTSMEAMSSIALTLHGEMAKWLLVSRMPGYENAVKCRKNMVRELYKILEEHKVHFDPHYCEDFVDVYLREKELKQKKNDPQAQYFTDEAFIGTLILLYGDGSLTIAAVVILFLKVLSSKLDVQNAIYEEIVSEIGTNRPITYDDRSKLPYVFSAVKEIERNLEFLTIVPSVVAKKDTVISGNFVPKGTIALINMAAIHRDPVAFKDPSHFNPKRFMSDDKNVHSKAHMPILFSIGRRSCAGETLVMTEVFVFLACILQQFTLHPAKEIGKNSNFKNRDEQIFACNLIAKPRNHKS